jgi:hypothetical protein
MESVREKLTSLRAKTDDAFEEFLKAYLHTNVPEDRVRELMEIYTAARKKEQEFLDAIL